MGGMGPGTDPGPAPKRRPRRRTFFFRTRAVNYIWANRIPKGTALPNAFTSNAMMVAVESGDEKTGTWVAEERNVYEDYRTLFGEDPPAIGAVALMTDTDNTGGEATAYYGDITLQALPARPTIAPPTAAR